MKVIFLGAGAWGTAMAMHASKNPKDCDVTLWSRSSSLADEMTKTHCNQKYLPSIDLPPQLKISSNWEAIFTHASEQDLVVIATPVAGLKDTVHALLKL
ncbi:MAG: glycerol-3-phosphate dehydrogenase, partial [Polynucleobacter victoriensis]